HYEVAGIELAPDAAEFCRSRGLNVVTGVAADATLHRLGPSFDAVVLLDVIEHLQEPHETLALCATRLNPGGVVVLTTGHLRLPRRPAARRRLAADDAAAAFVVFHRGELSPARAAIWAPRRTHRSPLENRAALAHSVSSFAHAGPPRRGARDGEPDRTSGQSVRRHARRVAERVILVTTSLSLAGECAEQRKLRGG